MVNILDYNLIESDVLIIGSGAAGLRAAIEAKKRDANVILVTKRSLGSGSTAVAGGGHAGVFPPEYGGDPEDSTKIYFEDTVKGGYFINNQQLVKLMVENAANLILELMDFGVELSYSPFNETKRTSHGGEHSYRRSIGLKEGSSRLISQLLRKGKDIGVILKKNLMITDLLKSNQVVVGAIGFDTKTGKFSFFKTKSVVLATGSAGQIYSLTSCKVEATGDGFAMAYNIGCSLQDMEFVQFYPWRLIYPPLYPESASYTRIPLQSSVFSRGAILLNSQGERFMKKIDPVRKELTTRDVASRGIFKEIKEGRGVNGGVLLDISEVSDDDFLKSDRRYVLFKKKGIDIRKTKLIIAPEAHYFMGGVCINTNCETDLEGLFGAGEIIGGIDGANRVSANALTMCQVTGAIAGIKAAERAKKVINMHEILNEDVSTKIDNVRSYLRKGISPYYFKKELQKLMTKNVGIIRTYDGLEKALEKIIKLRSKLKKVGVSDFKELMNAVELKNMIIVSEMVTRAAIYRKESRGAHYKQDYPKQNDKDWKVNLIIKKKQEKMTISKVPVVIL